ncbi:homeobox-like domain superfamily [Holotrichia oblita]|uniref:Homeobox-like domain superfamily n=1 Tax=Holotrichia oblita TaxID=644536 RepID=A0ACB9TJG1_HOLOL|nr:homeobox-like domain superfamily [Holotrichia oblita]
MSRVRNKGIRSQWSSAQLKLAINAIKNSLSKKAASQKYNISRRTLTRYLEKNISKNVKMGRKTVLDNEQEEELSKRIVRLAEVGYPLTNKILRK